MKTAKIICSKTGIGNSIQFIPVINSLKFKGYRTIADSDIYSMLGIDCPASAESAQEHYVVFGYNHKKFWQEKAKSFNSKFIGFKYRIKSIPVGLGYYFAVEFEENIHEIENNKKLISEDASDGFIFRIPKDKSGIIAKRVLIGVSNKPGKSMSPSVWAGVAAELVKFGYEVLAVGDFEIPGINRISTPTLKELREVLSTAQYYIGTDSGIMHLADGLGIPSLIFFGNTSVYKNRPVTPGSVCIQKNMSCVPCFDFGRASCIRNLDYFCMNYEIEEIVHEFFELVRKQ